MAGTAPQRASLPKHFLIEEVTSGDFDTAELQCLRVRTELCE